MIAGFESVLSGKRKFTSLAVLSNFFMKARLLSPGKKGSEFQGLKLRQIYLIVSGSKVKTNLILYVLISRGYSIHISSRTSYEFIRFSLAFVQPVTVVELTVSLE
ncbi:hypothetical protein EQO05_10290 [Methanosarcina sp. MSH10X1]|uniref:hypothetical protein n=1 Tax=Methanosarcina sp. MSH10X1 TaxID=2507075 RepID=UPI000FFB61C9|nr:hypothetical protein [Methanosarcina sp. MSH10X1]RXA19036.1 hypothetical protein EQO05_10290 [Methanosarcina sp. MSH10X1]